jgi:hypothetical protein
MTHASTPRSAATAACRSTALPSPKYGKTDLSLGRYPRSEPYQPYIGLPDWNHRPRTRQATLRPNQTSEPAPSETSIPVQAVQPPIPARKRAKLPYPHGSGLPGFGAYTGKKWYNSDTEEQDEHDEPPLPATTSSTRRSFPVPKYEDRHSEPEPASDSKPPGPIKDDKSPGGDREQPGTGKMSPESEYHFDFCPDTSSEGSNPADHEPIPNVRNAYYPKFCIDEFENVEDTMRAYVRYRIACGRMKFIESDTGSEQHYTRFPGIELEEIGDWCNDFNNVAPCEWSMSSAKYIEWFLSTHPKPVDVRQATRFWLDRREMLWRRQHPAPGSYEEFLQRNLVGPGKNYEDEDGYDYISHPEDTWDKGSLYRMHMLRLQAALDLTHGAEDGAYTMEQHNIDNNLIANHEVEEGETGRTANVRRNAKNGSRIKR